MYALIFDLFSELLIPINYYSFIDYFMTISFTEQQLGSILGVTCVNSFVFVGICFMPQYVVCFGETSMGG